MTTSNVAPGSASRCNRDRHQDMLDALDDSTRRIEDREAIERLTYIRGRSETLTRRLSAAHGTEVATKIMQFRRDCIHHVMTAMACSESLAIVDGVVIVNCTFPAVLTNRLAKFNHRRGERLSPAAHVYRMLQKGTL